METDALEYAFVRGTEAAAIAAGRLVGLGDKNAVDGAAVEAMRTALAEAPLNGVVVIGEGEKDEAPMLYHGEEIGNGRGESLDIAVDPIDGTTLASKGGPGAIAVIAAAPRGRLFRTRVPYMDKVVTGPAGRGVVSIDQPLEENLRLLARAKGCDVSDLTVALLDRPRNEPLMRAVRTAGARVRVFGDGDVANAVYAVLEARARVDMLAGMGYNLKYQYKDVNRVGDHICYITDLTKTMNHFPEWKLEYDLTRIVSETIEHAKKSLPELAIR